MHCPHLLIFHDKALLTQGLSYSSLHPFVEFLATCRGHVHTYLRNPVHCSTTYVACVNVFIQVAQPPPPLSMLQLAPCSKAAVCLPKTWSAPL